MSRFAENGIIEFFHRSHLIRFNKFKIDKKSETSPGMEPGSVAYQSGTLTTTLHCLQCLCGIILEPYSCLCDSVQFIEFDENLFILEKLDCVHSDGSIPTLSFKGTSTIETMFYM